MLNVVLHETNWFHLVVVGVLFVWIMGLHLVDWTLKILQSSHWHSMSCVVIVCSNKIVNISTLLSMKCDFLSNCEKETKNVVLNMCNVHFACLTSPHLPNGWLTAHKAYTARQNINVFDILYIFIPFAYHFKHLINYFAIRLILRNILHHNSPFLQMYSVHELFYTSVRASIILNTTMCSVIYFLCWSVWLERWAITNYYVFMISAVINVPYQPALSLCFSLHFSFLFLIFGYYYARANATTKCLIQSNG